MRMVFVLSACVMLAGSPVLARAGLYGTAGTSRQQSLNNNVDAGWKNCLPDFNKYCPGQQRQHGGMAKCLGAYQANVTEACKPVLNNWCSRGYC